MVLYIFVTHLKNISNCYDRIDRMMGCDYLVVHGNNIKDNYEPSKNILKLNCNDTYIGLTEKVIKTFHFILSNNIFDKYTHFIKLDDDIEVIKKFNYEDIKNFNYFGKVMRCLGNMYDRTWHMGKTNTYWDKIPYQGDYTPFCSGGFGYGVSRNSLEKILPNYDYITNIYEDVNMGLLMNSINIKPLDIINIEEYLASPDHNINKK